MNLPTQVAVRLGRCEGRRISGSCNMGDSIENADFNGPNDNDENTDPLFTFDTFRASAYHLSAASLGVGACRNTVNRDLDGNARPNLNVNRGAFEVAY